MSQDEIDDFLANERTCRVATVGTDGPHATPLWYCWHDRRLWLYSITRSQRWVDLQKDPRISAVVDAGHDFSELHGVEIVGTVAIVGEVPRTGHPAAELEPIESQFVQKYFEGDEMFHDGRHAWLELTPTKITSWDFRKIGN
jgi:hypothetical protein